MIFEEFVSFATYFDGIDVIGLARVLRALFAPLATFAIVVGITASCVSPALRSTVIFLGITAAVVLHILLAAMTTQLLQIVGLRFVGGLLLLWVGWKMYRSLVDGKVRDMSHNPGPAVSAAQLGLGAAVFQVALAAVPVALHNLPTVAGVTVFAAGGDQLILLAVAIIFTAVTSLGIARLLVKQVWIAWIGLSIIIFVALDMIYAGSHNVVCSAYGIGCSETLFQGILHRLGLRG